MRTAAYCRFSSDQQREASIRDQLRNIEAFCARQAWPTPALYQDQAMSGSRKDRPGYRALLEAAEVGAFDVLLIDDLSRLSRDHIESAQVIRRLKYAGVRVIGVSDGTDTARDGYKLETGLRGLMSELYLDDLAKKTHRGLKGQALDGYSAGGQPYGYRSTSDGKGWRRHVFEDEARWVRYVFERYAAGASPRQIADELNARGVPSARGGFWAHSALYPDNKMLGMLGNPIYAGQQVWNRTEWTKDPATGRRRRTIRPRSDWVIVDSPELRIVDEATWTAVEARIKAMRLGTAQRQRLGRGAGGRKPKYLFSGLLVCGVCGGAYVMQDQRRYGCATHKDRGAAACGNELKVRRATVEKELLANVKMMLLSETAYRTFEQETRKLLESFQPDPAAAKARLAKAGRERDNILTAIRAGIITPTTKQALLDAEDAVACAHDELRLIEQYEPSQMLPRAREIYRDLVDRLESVEDVASAREALRDLIGQVRLIPENGTLTAEIQSAGLAGALKITLVAGEGTKQGEKTK
ncbi:MAG: recombinase family protein [Azoarcus sp.]|jgi:DNA invertase Pin-like site-specific DNA recombinase|nr:recombinase family protein [Azoarcus sp.]